MGFIFHPLECESAVLIENYFVRDSRGSFVKCFEKDFYRESGICFQLSETFVSSSVKNVLRGLHFQLHNPQAKIVSVLHGRAWDVIVDLRPNSKTYMKWISVELNADNHRSLYVPRGFAHGFVSMEDDTIMLYQCDGEYDPKSDTGIRFDDPHLNVRWPIDLKDAILSDRDKNLMNLEEYESNPMEKNW